LSNRAQVWSAVASFAAVALAANTARLQIQYQLEHKKQVVAANTSSALEKQTEVSDCLLMFGSYKQEHSAADNDYAKRYALDRSTLPRPPHLVDLERCRKLTQNYYYWMWYMMEQGLIDASFMETKGYAESGNYAALMEPIEKQVYVALKTQTQGISEEEALKLYDDARPHHFKQIDKAKSDPRLRDFF